MLTGDVTNFVQEMGGWPVLEGVDWDEESFSWIETVYTFRQHGYSTDYLIDFSIVTDSKNSSWRVIDIDQASLGMSREYLVNGLEDDDVNSYYNYMVNVAVLLGADRATAAKELKESLEFEISLAHASQAREKRRNATRLYNPMRIDELHTLAPMVPWLDYINNILTKDLTQVEADERVIVDEPGYLKNLTALLPKVKKRTIANYMVSLYCDIPGQNETVYCSSSGEWPAPHWDTSMRTPGRSSWTTGRTSPAPRHRPLGGGSVPALPVAASPVPSGTCTSPNTSMREPSTQWRKWSGTSGWSSRESSMRSTGWTMRQEKRLWKN